MRPKAMSQTQVGPRGGLFHKGPSGKRVSGPAPSAEMAEHLARRQKIDAFLAGVTHKPPAPPAASTHPGPAPDPHTLLPHIEQAHRQLDTYRDGLVDLHRLRQALPHVPREHLDSALFALERQRKLTLQISNDPMQSSIHPASGIHVPGRGLVYFVRLG